MKDLEQERKKERKKEEEEEEEEALSFLSLKILFYKACSLVSVKPILNKLLMSKKSTQGIYCI